MKSWAWGVDSPLILTHSSLGFKIRCLELGQLNPCDLLSIQARDYIRIIGGVNRIKQGEGFDRREMEGAGRTRTGESRFCRPLP